VSIQITAQTQQTQAGVAAKKTAQKTNKLGAFVKLLDGLIAKQSSGEDGKQTVSVKLKASQKIVKNIYEGAQIPRNEIQQSERKQKPQKKEETVLVAFIDKNEKTRIAEKKSLSTRTKAAVEKVEENVKTVLTESKDIQSATVKAAVNGPPKYDEAEKAEKKSSRVEQTPQTGASVREAVPVLISTDSAVSTNEAFAKTQTVKADSRLSRKIRDKFDVQDVRTEQTLTSLEQMERQTPNRSETVLDMAVDLRSNTAEDMPVDHKPQTFADILTRQLDGGLSSDIVKQATMVLKDGGQGVIRLSLKPEMLGSVKIRLEMSENKVMGYIIVDSGDALHAFDKAVPSLEQAFKDSGFETATLNASLSNNGGRGENAFRRNSFEEKPFFSERFVALTYDNAFPINGYAERRSVSVDLLA
jgi:flagellar hook-length control protein FliK